MTLPANWQDGQSFSAAAEDAVESAINSLMTCVPTAAPTVTLSSSNAAYVFTGSASANWTLPTIAGSANKILRLYNRGTASVNVKCAGSDQVNNSGFITGSITLYPNGAYELINDGTYWLATRSVAALPSYDNSAMASFKSGLASGTAATWTQNVGAGAPYGIVCLASTGSTMSILNITTATVTFGGVTLQPMGAYPLSSSEWLWIFGGSGIPSGTQTVSVTLTQTGSSFVGFMSSYTYLNVVAAGICSSVSGGSPFDINGLRTGSAPSRLFAAGVTITPFSETTATPRQQLAGGGYDFFGGDVGICGPERFHYVHVPGGFSSDMVSTLELLNSTPTGPWLQAVGGAVIGGTGNQSWPHTAHAGAYVLVAFVSGAGTNVTGVTYGGTPMTQLGFVWNNNDATGASGVTALYGLNNVGAGTKPVSVTVTGGGAWTGQSVSYMQVSSVGTAVTARGTGTSLSQGPITCGGNQVIFQCFGSLNGGCVETDPGSLTVTNVTGGTGLVINEAFATNTFTGTTNSGPWGGAAVVLS